MSDALVFMIASIALSISSPMPALLACGGQRVPAGALGYPEDAFALVLVHVVEELARSAISGTSSARSSARICVAALGEGVGHVLEEDQAEDEVLVLGGVHRAAQLVGGLPQRCRAVRPWSGVPGSAAWSVLLPRWHYSSCPCRIVAG